MPSECPKNALSSPDFGWSAKKNGSSPNNYRKFMALISLTQSQPPGLMDGLPAWILILAEMAAEAYLGKTANWSWPKHDKRHYHCQTFPPFFCRPDQTIYHTWWDSGNWQESCHLIGRLQIFALSGLLSSETNTIQTRFNLCMIFISLVHVTSFCHVDPPASQQVHCLPPCCWNAGISKFYAASWFKIKLGNVWNIST